MKDTCGIYFWDYDYFKDTTGCLKEYGHEGGHLFKDNMGRLIEWEDDFTCNCGCLEDDDDLINICKIYKEIKDENIHRNSKRGNC